MFEDVNLVAVATAAVVSMLVGFLWYSPMLFGKQWMKLMGKSEEDMEKAKGDMGRVYFISFVANLVMACVLGVLINFVGASKAMQGMQVGFWVWLGFVATTMLTGVLYEGKKIELYLINTGYQLVSILSMAAVLVMWG